MPFFIGPVPEDSLPKDAAPGCTLNGNVNLAKTGPSKGDGNAPTKPRLIFTVPPPAKRKEEEKKEEDGIDEAAEEARPPAEALADKRRDGAVRCCRCCCNLRVHKYASAIHAGTSYRSFLCVVLRISAYVGSNKTANEL